MEKTITAIAFTLPAENFNEETIKQFNLGEEEGQSRVFVAGIKQNGEIEFTRDPSVAYKIQPTDNVIAAMINTFAEVNDFKLTELTGRLKEDWPLYLFTIYISQSVKFILYER